MKNNIWLKALVLVAVILFSFHTSALTQSDVVGEWHLNESAGTNAPDTSTGGFDGTLTNMEDGDWVSGQLNNALVFDGVDEFVDLNGVGDFERTDTFSLEFWFKTSTAGTELILSKQLNTGNFRGWNVFIETGKLKVSLINNNGASDRLFLETNATFNDNVFHHVVVTYAGTSLISGLIVYVDGSAVATTTLTDALTGSITNAVATQISGRDGANAVFNGTVDEVVFYDVVLTAGDVTGTFNNGTGTEFHPPVSVITLDVVHPNGGEGFDNVSISTVDINFNVQSPDTNLLFVDLNFSTSGSQGTGTVIIQDINTDSSQITCADADFTNTTLCTFSWNIDAVADNNYFILATARDEFSSFIDFDASDATFEIFTTFVVGAPITVVIHPNGGESFNNTAIEFVDINFTVQDDDNNSLLVDLNFSTGSSEGSGTVIINDINTDSATITCADSDFSDTTLCTFAWDIDSVPDGSFFILDSVTDGTNSDFDASDASFTVFTGGFPPDANMVHPNGGESFDTSSVTTIDLNFNVQDPDDNTLSIDLNFSTTGSQGSGTPIATGLSTDDVLITCADSDFSDSTLCTFSWNITAIADNDYFILLNVSDGDSTTSDVFDASDATFEITTPVIPTAPVVNVISPNGSESFDNRLLSTIEVNFTVIDSDDDTLLIDLNFSTSQSQGTGTVIINDVNTTGGSVTCADADFSNTTSCTVTWNIDSVPDGQYFILLKGTDGTFSDFDTSFATFSIFTSDDPAEAPTLTGIGLIDGGGFEGTEVNDNWFDAVCGKTASPPLFGAMDRAGAGGWIADTNLSTEGSLAGFCRFGFAIGSGGVGNSGSVCIIKPDATKKDCTVFTNDSAPFPTEQFLDVKIDLTFDYGSDFNILMSWFSTIDRNFFSIAYNGSTELSSGDKLLIDIELCKSGANQCNTGELIGSINGYIGIDNVRIAGHLLTVQEPSEPIPSFSSFEITARVQDDNGFNPNADVNFFLEGDTDVMVFSDGFYRFTVDGGLATGDFDFNVVSVLDSVTRTVSGTLEVRRQEFQYLTITPIENISSFVFGSVDFTVTDTTEGITWRVDSNSTTSETPLFKIFNDRTDGRQYFIFTSPDGSNFAFNDTLTFGADEGSVIQKIWSEDTERYTHSFEDTIPAGGTRFYKLTYRLPYKHFFSIKDSPEWSENLQPNVTDNNTFAVDEYSISNFSNIRSFLIQQVPDIFEDETFAFELQVTAHTDINGTVLLGGQTVLGADNVTGVILTSEPKRFSFTIDATDFESQALLKTASGISARVFLTDYAIVARGFFTKRLKLRQANNDPLNVFLQNSLSTRYLQEGRQFRLDTEAYDREGTLRVLEVKAFLDGTSTVNNLVKTSTFDIETVLIGNVTSELDEESVFSFTELFPAIIDLNGNAENPIPPRTLTVQARITDTNGTTVAVQSRTVTFLQYPFFPDDLRMNFFPTEKRLGKNPSGLLEVFVSDPNTLRGFDFRIFSDGNTVSAPNHRDRIFKDTDFTCNGSLCNIQIKFDEFVFEDTNLTTITTFALLNTEFLDEDNRLTRVDRRIFVTPIEFETAKIYQQVHRTDRTYRNNEEISLILVLRDSESTSLRNKLDITLSIRECDLATGENCTPQTIKYQPTGFVYDDKFNYNYYFFRHLYVLDNGSLLQDGKFYDFRATVADRTGTRTTVIPVLADKCKNNDISIGNFFAGGLSFLLEFGKVVSPIISGCQTVQENIVTTATNNDQEVRLLIDEDHVLTNPTQELFFCIAPDSNNVISRPLEQDVLCATWYTTGEKPIDDFRLRITNSFSDLSIDGASKQYKEFNIPFEVIAINDIQLLKQELLVDQTTTIDTVGDFFYETLNNIARDYLNIAGLQDKANFIAGNGILTNIGADLDFSKAFSPANITGAVFYRIKGVPVTNVQDFKFDTRLDDQFESVDRRQFLNFLATKNISIPQTESTLEVIVSDLTVPIVFKDNEGSLIIDEVSTNQQVNSARAEDNANLPNQFIPNILSFTVQHTMFFNNFSEQETRSLILRIAINIKDSSLNAVISFFDDVTDDPAGTITQVLLGGAVFLAILIMLIFMVSLIWRNFNTGGNGGSGDN